MPMKKILCLLSLCLLSLTAHAQERFSYTAEVVAGVGISRGPIAFVTPQFVARYDLGNGFRVGAGAGARVGLPCEQYITTNGTFDRRSFCGELDIPVFLRLDYCMERLYAGIDAGYAIGVFSIFGAPKEPCYSGFFVEPHIGLRLGKTRGLAFGVIMQQSIVYNSVHTNTSESSAQTVTRQELLTPAITLRYISRF